MAKTTGGVRTFKQGTSTYSIRQVEVENMMASGIYSSVEMTEGGGYLAIEKSPMKHTSEEIEAGKILASKGYKVILKDEANSDNRNTIDGYVFSTSYEQRTPTKDNTNTIKNALKHARSKRAEIAVLYSKYHLFSRESVEEGIKLWEEKSTYRFKKIIVVADNGNVHIHKHNK